MTTLNIMRTYLTKAFWLDYADKVKDSIVSYALSNFIQEDLRNA